jgi:hypothetical protein
VSYESRNSRKAKRSTAKTLRVPHRKKGSPRSSASDKSGSRTLHLNEDWTAFLRALTSQETRFLLIGGHAVAVHAEPRFTEDLDVFVEPSLRNARKLRAALVEFGFASVAPAESELAEPDRVWMLGRKPRRIDVLTGISGVSFAQASRGSVTVPIAGESIRVIGRAALIKNKLASGRPKDRLDVELLNKYGRRSTRR